MQTPSLASKLKSHPARLGSRVRVLVGMHWLFRTIRQSIFRFPSNQRRGPTFPTGCGYCRLTSTLLYKSGDQPASTKKTSPHAQKNLMQSLCQLMKIHHHVCPRFCRTIFTIADYIFARMVPVDRSFGSLVDIICIVVIWTRTSIVVMLAKKNIVEWILIKLWFTMLSSLSSSSWNCSPAFQNMQDMTDSIVVSQYVLCFLGQPQDPPQWTSSCTRKVSWSDVQNRSSNRETPRTWASPW